MSDGTPTLGERYAVQVFDDRQGGMIAENTSVKLSIEGKDADMETPFADWIGFTPGSKARVIDITNLTTFTSLLGGISFERCKKQNVFVTVQLTKISNGATCEFIGRVVTVSKDSKDGSNTEESVQIRGQPSLFSDEQ